MKRKKSGGDLKWLSPKEIRPSKENPRRNDFFKDKHFLRLKESVAKHGVIVPAIVKRLSKETNGKRYKLIDGERRWQAAIDTNTQLIPAYVWPPGKDVNILATMFQIHMNQEGWEAVEQARALESMVVALAGQIKRAGKTEDQIDRELATKLSEITDMKEETALSRIKFLKWPEKLREYIYDKADKRYYSYAVEIEEKIVDPAIRNYPELKEKISPKEMRMALFEKVTTGLVERAAEIRDAQILTKKRRDKSERPKVRKLIMQFVRDESLSFSEVREQYIALFPEEAQKPAFSLKKLTNTIRSLVTALSDYTEVTVRRLKPKQKEDLKEAIADLIRTANRVLRKLR